MKDIHMHDYMQKNWLFHRLFCYYYQVERKQKIALTCCSNARKESEKDEIGKLIRCLESMGLETVQSSFLYSQGSYELKAKELMEFYENNDISDIFDISGGNLSNTLLPLLDYKTIEESEKRLWGYSDLTALINGIYQKTGRSSMLYQIRNLVRDMEGRQEKEFKDYYFENKKDLLDFSFSFIQGDGMHGIVVGGNARCLLKLAGTPYFPDMNGCILFLESLHGNPALIESFFSQLEQMEVFEKASGIILGTFTEMEEKKYSPSTAFLLSRHIRKPMPVAKTYEIGHACTSKALRIGEYLSIEK